MNEHRVLLDGDVRNDDGRDRIGTNDRALGGTVPAVAFVIAMGFCTHKVIILFKKSKWIYLLNLLSVVILILTSGLVSSEVKKAEAAAIQKTEEHEIITNLPKTIAAIGFRPDYIEGTEFTHKRLEEIFPFGYAIFFYGQNRILRNEIITNGLMDWTLDVDQVKIYPDFNSSSVSWDIPDVSAQSGGNIHFSGVSMHWAVPANKGIIYPGPFAVAGKPTLNLITLGDNQRLPVFALGFRISSEAGQK